MSQSEITATIIPIKIVLIIIRYLQWLVPKNLRQKKKQKTSDLSAKV